MAIWQQVAEGAADLVLGCTNIPHTQTLNQYQVTYAGISDALSSIHFGRKEGRCHHYKNKKLCCGAPYRQLFLKLSTHLSANVVESETANRELLNKPTKHNTSVTCNNSKIIRNTTKQR